MSITKRFKNTKFANWFKRTFKKQDDLTAGEITAIILLLLLLAAASPVIAAKNLKKKK